jgi:cytochrome c biogenesis protein CcmG/thiol:disulfide interchange protein DsbE
MTSSRDSRREAARARDAAASRNRWLLIALAGAVIVVAAIAAIVLGGSGDGGSSARPSDQPSASVAPGSAPVVSGAGLPDYAGPLDDAAVGLTIPTVTSTAADGTAVDIALDGSPKALLFLAHWCPHCQAEVPVIQDWVDAGGWPADVELISVSTAIDASAPNYPPDDWLAREGWTAPVITDPTGAVATAYGLTGFPYFVFVNADGTVAGRATGELPIEDLETILAGLER